MRADRMRAHQWQKARRIGSRQSNLARAPSREGNGGTQRCRPVEELYGSRRRCSCGGYAGAYGNGSGSRHFRAGNRHARGRRYSTATTSSAAAHCKAQQTGQSKSQRRAVALPSGQNEQEQRRESRSGAQAPPAFALGGSCFEYPFSRCSCGQRRRGRRNCNSNRVRHRSAACYGETLRIWSASHAGRQAGCRATHVHSSSETSARCHCNRRQARRSPRNRRYGYWSPGNRETADDRDGCRSRARRVRIICIACRIGCANRLGPSCRECRYQCCRQSWRCRRIHTKVCRNGGDGWRPRNCRPIRGEHHRPCRSRSIARRSDHCRCERDRCRRCSAGGSRRHCRLRGCREHVHHVGGRQSRPSVVAAISRICRNDGMGPADQLNGSGLPSSGEPLSVSVTVPVGTLLVVISEHNVPVVFTSTRKRYGSP